MHRIHSPQTRTVIAVILSYRVPTTIRGRVSTTCPNRDDISREIEPMPVTGCDIPLRRKPQRSAQNADSARVPRRWIGPAVCGRFSGYGRGRGEPAIHGGGYGASPPRSWAPGPIIKAGMDVYSVLPAWPSHSPGSRRAGAGRVAHDTSMRIRVR